MGKTRLGPRTVSTVETVDVNREDKEEVLQSPLDDGCDSREIPIQFFQRGRRD